MLIILVFGMMRQKDNCECEASLDYRVRFCLRKEKRWMRNWREEEKEGGRGRERESGENRYICE